MGPIGAKKGFLLVSTCLKLQALHHIQKWSQRVKIGTEPQEILQPCQQKQPEMLTSSLYAVKKYKTL